MWTVLISGLVAVVLNVIIPRETLEAGPEDGEGEEVEQVVEEVEASSQAQKA